ncbi:MarR family winged helix-turn-helix transcriptional regulator [Streptococcus sp. zg-JUN1979]|uniref:MarR family winged helix-turn-helix transcriptional regulator n=1 Tax=Streptococcus sp. zg-JUN1979 TaxID=3391450 RepID=UPI0039A57CA5
MNSQKGEKGGYLTLHIRLLNGRLFNKLLAKEKKALYSAEQGKILSVLWHKEPQTATDLALQTGLANNSLSIMLKHLIQKNLIYAQTHPTDKRKKNYYLTPLGRKQQTIGQHVSQELAAIFYKDFSNDDIAQFEAYLEHIKANLEEALYNANNKPKEKHHD